VTFEIYVPIVHVFDVTLLCSYYSNVGDDEQCWIGLYKSEPEASDNSSYWLDGNPSTYRNWYSDGRSYIEPNEVNQCVRIYNGTFRDIYCGFTFRYVCKGM